MTNSGLNIEEIRRLNKLRIYGVKNGAPEETTVHDKYKQSDKPIFEAYLTSPIGTLQSAKLDTKSITQQMGEMIKGLGVVGSIANSAVGSFLTSHANLTTMVGQGISLANKLNYNYNYRFTDIGSFSHTFQCELVTKDDFFTDVIDPLYNLLVWVLPDETMMAKDTEQYKIIKENIVKYGNKIKDKGKDLLSNVVHEDILKSMWNGATDIVSEVDDMLGGLSIFTKPLQLSNGNSHSRIIIGDWIVFDNIIINSISFNVPYLYYENGLFDKVDVSISVEGNRLMSVKTFDWVRGLKNSNAAWNITGATLNDQFES